MSRTMSEMTDREWADLVEEMRAKGDAELTALDAELTALDGEILARWSGARGLIDSPVWGAVKVVLRERKLA